MTVPRVGIRPASLLLTLVALASVVAGCASRAATEAPAEDPSPTYSLCTGTPGGVLPTTAARGPVPIGGVDEVIRQADNLVLGGEPEAAAELYRLRLADNPADECAARGLAYIAVSSAGSSAEAAPGAVGMAAAADRWDSFYGDSVVPAAQLLFPFLAVLAVLYLLVHLAAGVVVGPNTTSPDQQRESGWTRRRATHWGGIACLVLAAGWATVGNAGLDLPSVVRPIAWFGAAVLAATGVWLAARGRGLALRVQIEGRDADGKTNALGSHVLARLQQLGSQRPRGIEVPQQTDVSTLPDDALSALPQSDLAKALLRLLRVVLPAVPWHVTVTSLGGEAITVLIARNGRLVDSTVIQFAPPPTLTSESAASNDAAKPAASPVDAALATAAAAFTLSRLAGRHPALTVGLAGATRWPSIFLQVRAASPTYAADPDRQRTMLAQAVEADPANVAARMALLHVDGRRAADADAASAYARGLGQLLDEVMPAQEGSGAQRPPAGWEALVIRMLFNLSVAWMHHFLFRVHAGETPAAARDSWVEAQARASCLAAVLNAERTDVETGELVTDIKPAAGFLLEAIRAAEPKPEPAQAEAEPAEAEPTMIPAVVPLKPAGQLSLTAVYTRACWHAIRDEDDAHLEHALDDLATVAVLETFRAWARRDPSFHVFRQRETASSLRARFRRIVGQPVPADFLALAPFAAHSRQLREFGIRTPEDLLAEKPEDLATALEVKQPQARRWQEVARLAGTKLTPDGDPLGTQLLFLLLAADVDSVAQLRSALRAGQQPALHAKLRTAAIDYAIEPPTEEDLRQWSPP